MPRSLLTPNVPVEALHGRYPDDPSSHPPRVSWSDRDRDRDREPASVGLHRRATRAYDDRPAGRMTLLPHS